MDHRFAVTVRQTKGMVLQRGHDGTELHGSSFEYFTGSALRTRNYFLPPGQSKGEETKHVVGGTVGGPVVRNAFFYFLSVESTFNYIKNGVFPAQIASIAPGIRSIAPPDCSSMSVCRAPQP